MIQYIYNLIYGEEVNNVNIDNNINIKNKNKQITANNLLDTKKKLKKTIVLKKHFFVPNIKELHLKKQQLNSIKPKYIIKPNELIKKKSTLKKTIIKHEPIRNLFLEELKKAKQDIYNKKNI